MHGIRIRDDFLPELPEGEEYAPGAMPQVITHGYRTIKPLITDETLAHTPNFQNKAIRKTITKALVFVQSQMKPNHAYQMSIYGYIKPNFGQTQLILTQWLMSKLLVSYDSYYSKGAERAMSYYRNEQGINEVLKSMGMSNMSITEVDTEVSKALIKSVDKDLDALVAGTIQYTDKSSRKWNNLQHLTKDTRYQLLGERGFWHSYDIQCCSATLLYQFAQSLQPGLKLDSIEDYIKDRTKIRNILSYDSIIPLSDIKTLITLAIGGGKIGCSKFFSSFRIADYDYKKMESLRDHPIMQAMKADISTMWKIINTTINRTYSTKDSGKTRLDCVTSKQRSEIYFKLERKVQDAALQYMNDKNVFNLLEHDGWTTNQILDVQDITDHIKRDTGYDIKLEYQDNKISRSK